MGVFFAALGIVHHDLELADDGAVEVPREPDVVERVLVERGQRVVGRHRREEPREVALHGLVDDVASGRELVELRDFKRVICLGVRYYVEAANDKAENVKFILEYRVS